MAAPSPKQPIDVDAAGASIRDIVRRVRERRDRIELADEGEPVAAVVPIDDVRRLEALDRSREDARATLRALGEFFRGEDPEVIEAEVEQAVAEARRQMCEERMATKAARVLLDEISADFADVPDEELEREVERAVRKARSAMRAERERAAITQESGNPSSAGTAASSPVSS